MHQMMSALVVFLLSYSIAASAQKSPSLSVQKAAVQAGSPETDTAPRADPLKLTLKTSLPQAAADVTFGISVEIENLSNAPVYLPAGELFLILPPEINPIGLNPSGDYSTAWQLGLSAPLDEKGVATVKSGSIPTLQPGSIVTLQPKSRTIAYFNLLQKTTLDLKHDLTPDRSLKGWWRRNVDALKFVPGDYTLRVVCPYWKDLDDARNGNPNYFTEAAEIKVPIVAAQTTILVGAALGGIMAFVLLPSLWLPMTKEWSAHSRWHKLFIVGRGFLVSALLSVMIAILLSRMSDSPFLVKVSVQDFWGAITIGFIAGTSGTAVLQRFTISQAEKQKSLEERGIVQAAPTSSGETKRLSTEAAHRDREAARRPTVGDERTQQEELDRIALYEPEKEEEREVVNQ